MSKVIVHIDLNAFFVRAEEIKNPELEGKAVAIGHNGRGGVVSTCSYKAREFGVRSAMPMNQAVKMCPELIIIPGDYHFYAAKSLEFKQFVKEYTKLVEEASIDEVFADFTEQLKGVKDVEQYFKDFQNALFDKTGLKCSIGVGPTKFLAKMGSDYRKPMGITIIRKKEIANIIYPLSINDMFGVGKRSAPRLKSIGIKTIGDLYNKLKNEDEDTLNILGKSSSTLLEWLEGKGDDTVTTQYEELKSIGNSTTLKEDTNHYDTIREYFDFIAREVSYRAKKDEKYGNTIQIMVKDTSFVAHNKSITLEKPINSYEDILLVAMKLYEKNFSDMVIRAVGITLQNLVSYQDMVVQMTFFDYEMHENESQTKLLINELNRKIKGPKLKRASEVKKK